MDANPAAAFFLKLGFSFVIPEFLCTWEDDDENVKLAILDMVNVAAVGSGKELKLAVNIFPA